MANTPLPVTGTVSVGNLPATQAVSGTVSVGNTPTVNVGNTPTVSVGNTPTVNVGNTPTVNVGSLPAVGIDPSADTVHPSNSVTDPLFTQTTDMPFQQIVRLTTTALGSEGQFVGLHIPAGQQAVIQHVALVFDQATSSSAEIGLRVNNCCFLPFWNVPVDSHSLSGSADLQAVVPMDTAVGNVSDLTVSWTNSLSPQEGTMFALVTGYLRPLAA